jgi:hypothetical protein
MGEIQQRRRVVNRAWPHDGQHPGIFVGKYVLYYAPCAGDMTGE